MPQPPGRRGARVPRAAGAAALGCLGLACWAASGRWPGPAQAGPRVKELDLSSPGKRSAGTASAEDLEPGSCAAALARGKEAFEPARASWSSAKAAGRLLPAFGRLAAAAERKALASFDEEAAPSTCSHQRALLEAFIRHEAWTAFLQQRRLAEEDVSESLANRLVKGMEGRGGPLRVQEKVDMLREAVASYKSKVQRLLPEWAEQGDPERAEVEQRLGALQFGIEESPEGRRARGLWEQRRERRILNERAHGVAISLDPELRVMIRPEGLGNLQVFSVGPVGPPNSPALVQVGVMNDRSFADVYREHPVPPKVSVQPAVRVNVNLR